MKEKQVFNGRLLKVFVKKQKLPNGYLANIEYIKHPGAVLIIPVLANGSIVLIRQYRPAINKYIWELPAGTLEKGEPIATCAKRELIEETGYKAARVKKIAVIVPVPGYSTEKIHIFRAEGLKQVKKQAMVDEVIIEKAFSLKQIKKMLAKGEIVDAKTICGLNLAAE